MSPLRPIDWGLRDYGEPGQLGLEPTPAEYVGKLVDVFREVRRVLRGDGTAWLNLGDSYAATTKGSGGPDSSSTLGGAKAEHNGQRMTPRRMTLTDGLKPKDLVGIPWRVAFALQADGWYLRSDIIWSKPNPMPESVTDRPTKAHEYLFLLSKSPRYFYDADAVREANAPGYVSGQSSSRTFSAESLANREAYERTTGDYLRAKGSGGNTGIRDCGSKKYNGQGRNRRSVWTIATQPFPGCHFAVMPPALVRPCILAGTSARGVCPECGAPWERVVERESTPHDYTSPCRDMKKAENKRRKSGRDAGLRPDHRSIVTTTGWRPTCDHTADPIPATVLDPFAGAGTVPLVAAENGRSYIGIELNAEYAEMARERIRLRGKTPVVDDVDPGQRRLFG